MEIMDPKLSNCYKEMYAIGSSSYFLVQIGKFGIPYFYAFATDSYETSQKAEEAIARCIFQINLFRMCMYTVGTIVEKGFQIDILCFLFTCLYRIGRQEIEC